MSSSELIGSKIRRGSFFGVQKGLKHDGESRTAPVGSAVGGHGDNLQLVRRAPSLSNEGLASQVVLEQIHSMIDALLLQDTSPPSIVLASNSHEKLLGTLRVLGKNEIQIILLLHQFVNLESLLFFGRGAVKGVGSKRFTQLADLLRSIVTLSQNQKSRFLHIFVSVRIQHIVLNILRFEKDVTPGNSPHNSLENSSTLSGDRTNNSGQSGRTTSTSQKRSSGLSLLPRSFHKPTNDLENISLLKVLSDHSLQPFFTLVQLQHGTLQILKLILKLRDRGSLDTLGDFKRSLTSGNALQDISLVIFVGELDNLAVEVTKFSFHFVNSLDVINKSTLWCGHSRIHILKLDLTDFTQFINSLVSHIKWDHELDEGHRLRSEKLPHG
mmetsp:Transcript_38403/g.60846  ORF Transcript_38403/g.60846 Transcript_38403/m.60846 type:complete len:383 (-) Transcript_38403:81-1229(-)